MDLPDLARLVHEAPRDELPALLGRLVELEARVRLRLADVSTVAPTPAATPIDADRAAEIAATSKRWLLAKTRGMAFRRDLSRKAPRFDEAGLRSWLAGRRR